MIDASKLTPAEFELYLGLLPLAYQIYKNKTGLVCGACAENLRDQMFSAIMNSGAIAE